MKVIVTIAILFSHIYGTTMDEIKVHGASAEKFRQMVFEFTDTSRIANNTSTPFEDLSQQNITILKIAAYYNPHSSNYDQLAAICSEETKEIIERKKVKEIRLKHELNTLSAIEEPAFAFIRMASQHSLAALSKPGLWAKPRKYQATAMQQWIEDWQQVMQSLENIIDTIRLAH